MNNILLFISSLGILLCGTTNNCLATHQISDTTTELYLGSPNISQNKPFFHHTFSENENKIREAVNKTKISQLEKTYPEYFVFYESNEISRYKCHEYALAKLLGYDEIPSWLSGTFSPSDFNCDRYLRATANPRKGDLAVYYYADSLCYAEHFGIYSGNGNKNIISTWGSATDNAYIHAPFFADGMYGDHIVFYTFPEEKDASKVRSEIEYDEVYSKLLNSLTKEKQEELWEETKPLLTKEMLPENVLAILKTVNDIKDQEERTECVTLTSKLIQKHETLLNDIQNSLKYKAKDSYYKIIGRHEVIDILRGIVYLETNKRKKTVEDTLVVLSSLMNGFDIAFTLKAVNMLNEADRTAFLKELTIITSRIEGASVSDVIKFAKNLSKLERSRLFAATMKIINGPIHWSNAKTLLAAMNKLPANKWEDVSDKLCSRYDLSCAGADFFVWQNRSLFEVSVKNAGTYNKGWQIQEIF